MDELVQEFIDETLESLSEIDSDLIKLETDPDNKDLLDKIFRLMHTIKGTCGFISLHRLERTAHVAENLLDHFRSGTLQVDEKLITLLLMSIDRVRYLVDEVRQKGHEPEGNDNDLNGCIETAIAEALCGTGEAVVPLEQEVAVPEPIQPEATPATHGKAEAGAEYLRVPMPVLESMIDMVSELVLSRNQLLQKARMEENSSFHASFQRLNRIVSDLQDVVMKTRMQPIGNAWVKLPRIVRDLSKELGKKINFVTEGEETELDRQVLELIKDPLTHMIRNSCDHGIESPQARAGAGKKEQGSITLRAFHEGGQIVIQIADDGKGIDPKIIGQKAVEKGLLAADKLAGLTDKQLLSYIMRPGFSTAEQITSVSGRGVGMDVVRANIEKIGGSIDIDSLPGRGSTFTIQIPLTLAIISGLIVELEGCRYAIPQINIQELVSLGRDGSMIEYISSKPVLRLRDKVIPLIDGNALFARGGGKADYSEKFIVVMTTGACSYGVIVDRIFDTEEVVIKSISSVLRDTHIYSGNTILGDGQVIMILDPGGIARQFHVEKDMAHMHDGEQEAKAAHMAESVSMLVFRAGSGVAKALPLPLVSRLQVFAAEDVAHSGEHLVVNFNDQIINLSFVDPQTQKLGEEDLIAVMLSDDRSGATMGIIIDDLIDIIDCEADLSTTTLRGGILGSTRWGKQVLDVLDVSYYLERDNSDWFSSKSHAHAPYVAEVEEHDEPETPAESGKKTTKAKSRKKAASKSKRELLLVEDSNFFRGMLQPILSAAGYRVTVAEDALKAIALHDEGRMYDIILSDIEMPRMNGYEFVERMRSDSQWSDTPFIAITSHNTQEDARHGLAKGFDEYVGKFEKDELLGLLATVRHNGHEGRALHG